ncbi:MAG: tyrosine-type recombinase/integrase [Mangrovibacterium sp.]|nr:tyrosine-type recombinase/integrase [Mangrovibacterium sp.]
MAMRFYGIYAEYIKTFIDIKRHCGFKYFTEEKILHLFDDFTIQHKERSVGISKELALAWSKKRENESDAYRYKRSITLNQFALYLSQNGKVSAMSHVPKPRKTFVPYIYTVSETDKILEICDRLVCVPIRIDSVRFVMPALLRFLVCTGVRIGEALDILDEDMDLKQKVFILRDTKNGKERLLPFTKSLCNVLLQYRTHRDRLNPNRYEPYFFITARGKKCNSGQIYKVFRLVLKKVGIPFKGNHYGPDVHQLRHTFAVRSLLQMVRNGMDMYSSLPILSTYLGHRSIEATNNYVRLTAEIYPELIHNVEDMLVNVFPCLKNECDYEND